MMKSFFKKLAFVMALAMVVSMAAPAGSALAAGLSVAYQAGGAVSELNVKAGAEQDLKFVGAPKNWKELGWSWTSSNEAVATVDAAGVVTAVADGTATITITVGTLTGSVVVNVGDAKAYDVTLGTADNKAMTAAELKEGASLDLNFYGVKDWNKNNYTVAWSVSGDAANVDKNGVVTAAKAGKAVVTASIVNNVTGVAHNVTPVEVTVAGTVNPDSFTAVQKDTDKFVLTFAEAKTAAEIKDGLTVSVKIADRDYPISFENVAVDGNNVTVTTYAEFENDEVYTLTYGKEVVPCTIVLGDIATVGVDYYTGKNKDNKVAFVAEEEQSDYVTLVPALFDQYGNDITAKYDIANDFYFEYEVSENVDAVPTANNNEYAFGAAGVATVTVTATWFPEDASEEKTVTGKTTFVVEKHDKIGFTFVKAGIADLANNVTGDDKYVVLNSVYDSFREDPKSPVWDMWGGWYAKTDLTFGADKNWDGHVYTAIFKDNRGNLITSNNDAYLYGSFSYESTNNEVLSITDGTGDVTVYKPGKANILVYFTPADGTASKKLVASTAIKVAPEPYPVSYKIVNASQATASDVVDGTRDDDLNDVTFGVQFLDQNGDVYTGNTSVIVGLLEVEENGSNIKLPEPKEIKWKDYPDYHYAITFDGSEFESYLGTNTYKKFSYKVSLEDHDVVSTVKTKSAGLSLTVRDTSEECAILRQFIENTEGGTKTGLTNDDPKKNIPSTYKFNIAYGDGGSKDVAVNNVIDYQFNWKKDYEKWPDNAITVRYQSTGGLNIANVPSDLLKNVNDETVKATTEHVGYVYYKISAPSKTTVAGNSNVTNVAWAPVIGDGSVTFKFNGIVDAYTPKWFDIDGVEFTFFVEGKDDLVGNGQGWVDTDEETYPEAGLASDAVYIAKSEGWENGTNCYSLVYKDVEGKIQLSYADIKENGTYYLDANNNHKAITYKVGEEVPAAFQYAGKGSYNVTFYTTSKEGKDISVAKTKTITVSNSQSEMKYLGLNPDYAGVTENFEFTKDVALDDTELKALINEQLLLSYDNLLLGEYYESTNDWDTAAKNGWSDEICGSDIAINTDASKITYSDGSIVITKLAFDVTLDTGKDDETAVYTTVVNVGVRIKEK